MMPLRLSRTASIVPMVLAMALLLPAAASAESSVGTTDAADAVSPAVSAVAPNIIGFESDTPGSKPEPFTSVDNPTVHFADSLGDDLSVLDVPETNGQGLVVLNDDVSELVVRLDVPTKRLSILFGNDDPSFAQAGDQATLTVYRFGRRVASESVVMNLNDLPDQIVEYRGNVPINRAKLVYNRAGTPINLIEAADDIRLSQVCPIRGNTAANKLVGNDAANGICGFGGSDRLLGRGGNDVLAGGNGNDRVNGGAGDDLVKGGRGNDTLRTADGVAGNDTAYGGPGNDTCIVDVGDTVYSCESVIIPA